MRDMALIKSGLQFQCRDMAMSIRRLQLSASSLLAALELESCAVRESF